MSTVRLDQILDVAALARAVDDKLVAVKKHPTAELYICDYTARAQYTQAWTHEVRMCRGLAVAGHPLSGEALIVARPFPKFANVGEHSPQSQFGVLPVGRSFDVFEKMDGSLGVAGLVDGSVEIWTRGSFRSDQAIAATRIWHDRYADYILPDGATMLFEILYPSNRIVVDYSGMQDLVLLAVIDNATGADLALPADWAGPRAATFGGWGDIESMVADVSASPAANAEGFVIRFAPDVPGTPSVRAKIKYAEYIRLHRLVTGVSSVTIWEHLSSGEPLDELLERVPDEFYDFVQATVADLTSQYQVIADECSAFADTVRSMTPKDAAGKVLASGLSTGTVFAFLKGQNTAPGIWKLIRPAFVKPFSTPSEL